MCIALVQACIYAWLNLMICACLRLENQVRTVSDLVDLTQLNAFFHLVVNVVVQVTTYQSRENLSEHVTVKGHPFCYCNNFVCCKPVFIILAHIYAVGNVQMCNI